mmetsp:Transcript_366/g.499  ORF Transcript_366/g.499 Transcript_366/m.499 type:complete len:208 (-) Transcript_366:936-1559(-)
MVEDLLVVVESWSWELLASGSFVLLNDFLVCFIVLKSEAEVSIWTSNVLLKVHQVKSFPQSHEGSTSFFLGAVEEDSVVNQDRLEEVREHGESENCSRVSNNGKNGNDGLDDVIVPSWGRDSSVQVSKDLHEHQLVVSDVLVVAFQNVLVDELVVLVDDLKRDLSKGVVDSVVVDSVVSKESNNSNGDSKEAVGWESISIKDTIGVE